MQLLYAPTIASSLSRLTFFRDIVMHASTIRDILTKHARLPQDVNTLTLTDDLYDNGLTSLSTVNIMLAIEDAFDIEFPDTKLNRKTFSSIESLVETVTELLNR